MGGHALQPLGRGIFAIWAASSFACLSFRLLQSEQLDQFFLGPQQTDLVFLELCAERRSGQVAVIDPQVQPGQAAWGNRPLVRAMATPFCFARVWSCLTVSEPRSAMSPFSKALLSLAFSLAWASAMPSSTAMGRENVGVPCDAWAAARGGHLATADGHRPADIGAAAVRMRGLLGNLSMGKVFAVQAAADRAHALVLHGQPFQLLDADPLVELEPAHVVGAERTSVRAIISMRYWALLNTRLPAWRKSPCRRSPCPCPGRCRRLPCPWRRSFRMVR